MCQIKESSTKAFSFVCILIFTCDKIAINVGVDYRTAVIFL